MTPPSTMASAQRPDAPATARNRQPIYQHLQRYLPANARILEIASGTGQHAVYYCQQQPGWHWQCTDLADRLPGIEAWLADLHAAGIAAPPAVALDCTQPWPEFDESFDALFSANSFHIMPWHAVQACIANMADMARRANGAAQVKRGGRVFIYGPFNYAGQFTSASNASFHDSLRERSAQMGIRDAESVEAVFAAHGCVLEADHAMPANNRLLVFRSTSTASTEA